MQSSLYATFPPISNYKLEIQTMASIRESFTIFFESWLIQQQSYLNKLQTLLEIPPEGSDTDVARRHLDLVEQVVGHYQQYYEEKSKAATEDVFLILSPPWFSSFERTLLWISGVKPSFIFQLVNRAVGDLTGEQLERIETLRVAVKNREREIGNAMSSIQESVAAPPLYGLLRAAGRLVDGEVSNLDAAMDELKEAMLVLTRDADALRGMAAMEVLEILSPIQSVKMLIATAQFQLQARRLGIQRDSQRQNN